jgi:hypothetical protein
MGTRAAEREYEAHTEFLFPSPGILYGVARLLDLGAQLDLYNESSSPQEADYRALYADWLSVGKDFKAVFEKFARQTEKVRARQLDIFDRVR